MPDKSNKTFTYNATEHICNYYYNHLYTIKTVHIFSVNFSGQLDFVTLDNAVGAGITICLTRCI